MRLKPQECRVRQFSGTYKGLPIRPVQGAVPKSLAIDRMKAAGIQRACSGSLSSPAKSEELIPRTMMVDSTRTARRHIIIGLVLWS